MGILSSGQQRIGEERLIETIQTVARKLGRPPSMAEYGEHAPYSANANWRYFDSWDDALEAAGLDPEERATVLSEDDVLESIRAVAEELGRPPLTEEYEEHASYSRSVHNSFFDTWADALDAAGYDPTERFRDSGPRRDPDEEWPYQCDNCEEGPFYTKADRRHHSCNDTEPNDAGVDWSKMEEHLIPEIRERLDEEVDDCFYSQTRGFSCSGTTITPTQVGRALTRLARDEQSYEGFDVEVWNENRKRKNYRFDATDE